MIVTSKYERYSKEELIRIIEERDRKPKFGLVWERLESTHNAARIEFMSFMSWKA